MADLDYARATMRLGIGVGDGSDADALPDTVWCNAGQVTISPLATEVRVPGGIPPFSLGLAAIECTIDSEGYLTYTPAGGQPQRSVWVVDLSSTKVNPHFEDGVATHEVTFRDVVAGDQRVAFRPFKVRLSGPDNDLTLVSPVPAASPVPIVQGERGFGIASSEVDAGDLVVTYEDGRTQNAGALPVGPGGSDSGVASYLASPTSETALVLAAKVGAQLGNVADPNNVAGALTKAAANEAIAAKKLAASETSDGDSTTWPFSVVYENSREVAFGMRPDRSLYPPAKVETDLAALRGDLDPSTGWRWALFYGGTSEVALGERTDGTYYPDLTSRKSGLVMVGDSLQENRNAAPDSALASTLGRSIVNIGVGGQTPGQIGARFGSTPTRLTVSGGVIPASGSVTVALTGSDDTNPGRYNTDGTRQWVGTLAGVPGTLAVTKAGTTYTLTFTRTAAGFATPAPAGTPFQTGYTLRNRAPIICLGRNGYRVNATDYTVNAIRDVLTWSRRPKEAIILGIPPSDDEYTGAGSHPRGAFRDNLDAHNAAIAAAFPTQWFDFPAALRSAAVLTAAGISPTSTDLADIADGITPTSFRSDNIHYNAAAYTIQNTHLAALVAARGTE